MTGNTRQAHELVHLGRARGIGDAVLERFFKAYFAEGRSVFDPESLVSLAQEAGLDPAASRQALDEGTYTAAVAAEGDQARHLGANGVPFFVIDSRFGVSGAQSIEVFRNTLERAAAAALPEARRVGLSVDRWSLVVRRWSQFGRTGDELLHIEAGDRPGRRSLAIDRDAVSAPRWRR